MVGLELEGHNAWWGERLNQHFYLLRLKSSKVKKPALSGPFVNLSFLKCLHHVCSFSGSQSSRSKES